MTPHMDCVSPHTTLDECISYFLTNETRHLPVCLAPDSVILHFCLQIIHFVSHLIVFVVQQGSHQAHETLGVVSPNGVFQKHSFEFCVFMLHIIQCRYDKRAVRIDEVGFSFHVHVFSPLACICFYLNLLHVVLWSTRCCDRKSASISTWIP